MSEAPAGGTEHMSDFEALMWQLEKNPALSNTFANITVLDRSPQRSLLLSRMTEAIDRVPKLRQRPVQPVGRLANPRWVTDPDFDIDHHIRWVNLGPEATDEELHAFVATLAAQPFDRERPLWDFTVVEGLAGGRAAMVQRMHHTITDGEGGIRLSTAFLDLERTPTPPADDAGAAGGIRGGGSAGGETPYADGVGNGANEDASPEQDTAANPFLEAARAIGDQVRTGGGKVIDALGSAASMVVHPTDAAELARSAGRQVQVLSRCSPIWTTRTLSRWYGTTTLELAAVREAAHRMGGSVNDFFVAGAAAGAGSYHRDAGAPVDVLRLSMPVSLRTDTPREERGDPMAGGNAFSPTQTLMPTGEMEPRLRFAEIHDQLDATRHERVMGALNGAAAVVNLLPTSAVLAAGERATSGIDFVCSNVRAAPFDLYIAGAWMEANYPVGPLAGTAFNLTTMSYRGMLFIGLHVDSGAVADPPALLADIERGYSDLFEAAEV
jgi:diacylglycerol O-acyltransferase